jgi:hypothetical protein
MGRPPKRPETRLVKNRTFRVRAGLDAKLQSAAQISGRSVSEEIERRVEASFEWEQARHTAQQWLEASREALQHGFETGLRVKGYKRVRVDQGVVWAEPGMDVSRLSVSIDAGAIVKAIEPDLVKALARALDKFHL